MKTRIFISEKTSEVNIVSQIISIVTGSSIKEAADLLISRNKSAEDFSIEKELSVLTNDGKLAFTIAYKELLDNRNRNWIKLVVDNNWLESLIVLPSSETGSQLLVVINKGKTTKEHFSVIGGH